MTPMNISFLTGVLVGLLMAVAIYEGGRRKEKQ